MNKTFCRHCGEGGEDGWELLHVCPYLPPSKPRKTRKELKAEIKNIAEAYNALNKLYVTIFKANQGMQHRAQFCTKCEFVTHDKKLFAEHLRVVHNIISWDGTLWTAESVNKEGQR